MAHDHAHHDHHSIHGKDVNKAFIAGIILNLGFVTAEAVAGFIIGSLALIADAGHNLADVGTLALSLLAFRLMKIRSARNYSYGYRKTSVIASLFNAVLLLVSIGAIVYEAIHRFMNPRPADGLIIALVAGAGILVNGFTAWLFMKDKEKDLNIRSAYLHLLADALVSVAALVAGLVIHFTGMLWVDPAMSIIIALVILFGTWSLLRDSLRLSLDGIPPQIDPAGIRNEILAVKGVSGAHHLHIWALSTAENALTVHLVIEDGIAAAEEQLLKDEIRHRLLHRDIHHVTLETERRSAGCEGKDC